jgi:hypothetical protein
VSVAREKPDRRWFGGAQGATWGLTLVVMLVGGLIAWVGLGTRLCEDFGSPGSDAFCNGGGWEASGLAIACLTVVAVLIPAAGVVSGSRRLFWTGLLLPLGLAVADVGLAAMLGRG